LPWFGVATPQSAFTLSKEIAMRHHTLFVPLMLASGLLAWQPTLAVDAHHPDQKPGTSAPSADQTIQKMQANTRKMQAQLEKLAQSKDPDERQRLMQEHMRTMQENMMMGKSLAGMGCPMMSGGVGMGMMGAGGMGMMGGAGPEAMMDRMQMMEKRMDMMQMMLEQMSRGQPASMPPAR
jgi:hypothetical protein